jgi:hypothetical protein
MRRIAGLSLVAAGLLAATICATTLFAQTPSDTEPSPTETAVPTETTAPTSTTAPTEPPPTEQPTEPPAPSPTAEGEEEEDDDDTNTRLIIGLIIGGILAVVGLAGLLFGRRGKGGGPSAGWQERATDTYGKAAALHDAMSVELAVTSPLSDDAEARQRWQNFQPRIDELSTELHALAATPKNEQAAAALTGLIGSLTPLRSALLWQPPVAPPPPAGAPPGTPPPAPQAAPSDQPPPVQPPSAAPVGPSPSEQLTAHIRQRLAEFDVEVRRFRTVL